MILAQCPVCQELFTSAADCYMSALPCGHVFHKRCVDTWFKTSSTCPQCRVNVKRTNTIVRLFFDIVPFPSFESLSNNSVIVQNSTSSQSSGRQSELRNTDLQLYKARSEVERLEDALRASERKLAHQTKLATDLEKEVATLTTLYTESDKLCEKERTRCRELRTELSSMKQFLREAEAMRVEAMKVRTEMEDMQNVKKLISGSEEAARELLSRYSLKSDTCQELKCNLESLCRWTAVLRGELTGAREKARNYRIELSRLRKLHATAAQRAARSENLVNQRNEQIQALEQQLSIALNHSFSGSGVGCLQPTPAVSTRPKVSASPDLFATPDHCSVQDKPGRGIRSAKLTTPDALALSPTNCPSTSELQKQLRTPVENPFRAKSNSNDRLELAVPFATASLSDECQATPQLSKTSFAKPNAVHDTLKPIRSHAIQRRPSVLYEMAIMRRHLVTTGEHPANVVSQQAPTSSSSSLSSVSLRATVISSNNRSKKVETFGIAKRTSTVTHKKRAGPSSSSKLSRLDNFILRQ